jgi:hypothetical protein
MKTLHELTNEEYNAALAAEMADHIKAGYGNDGVFAANYQFAVEAHRRIRKLIEMRALLEKCAHHLFAEIERKTLNESAADGTQALSREVSALLDATAAPSNVGG